MQKLTSLFLILYFVVVASTTTNAQKTLTLTEAVKTALQNSYDIQLVENNLTISKNNNDYGVAGALPILTASSNNNKSVSTIQQKFADPTRNTTKTGVDGNTLTAGLTASIIVFNGYRIMALKDRLALIEKQNGFLLQSQMQNTTAQVMQQYYNVVRQQAYLKTIEKSIEASQQRLDIVKTRQQIGVANQTDILQSNIDLNALLQAKQNQLLIIAQAKTDLARTINNNEDISSSIIINDTIAIDNQLSFDKGVNSVTIGLNNNPQLAALSTQVKINQQLEKETKALMYPTLRASTGYNVNSNSSAAGFSLLNETQGPFLGVNLSIPLYGGGAAKKTVANARISSKNAEIQAQSLQKDIFTNAYKTFDSYKNSIEQLPIESENYSMTNALLNLVMQKYQLGQATMVDVKQAQQSFENAGFRLISLKYTAKIAEIELKRISNQLKF
ncbi:MAG: TolC family protein [Chitinophagia bacterium]|jgi:outer membrane protein TolC|nr:TolC family protein [Chitinophagia bacterium]NCA30159.1 TolC family protein [Chitinophagia bacterium]NDD15459.1 TolC family protein [Chitinophagia bacterium]